jgi:hypothetical protein
MTTSPKAGLCQNWFPSDMAASRAKSRQEFSVVMEQPSTVSLGKHRQRGSRQVDNQDGMAALGESSRWSWRLEGVGSGYELTIMRAQKLDKLS